jgi:hypothetical protein
MATIYNLRASNNATFRWTRDLSQWAAVYNIATATIRMQARLSPSAASPVVYEWNSNGGAGIGAIPFDAGTNRCVFLAPLSDMGRMSAPLYYDCRLEFENGAALVMFSGRILWTQGLTRVDADSAAVGTSGIGDTVSVDREPSSSPVPLPLSLAAAVVSAQASAAAAQAAASLLLISNFEALLSAWFAGQPMTLPSADGAWWNDGGVPAQTSGGVALAMPAPLTIALFDAAITVWFDRLPLSADNLPGGAWWNARGLPAWTNPSAAVTSALTTIATLPSFDFGAALSAWFATRLTARPSSPGQFWNNGGIISRS